MRAGFLEKLAELKRAGSQTVRKSSWNVPRFCIVPTSTFENQHEMRRARDVSLSLECPPLDYCVYVNGCANRVNGR
jgi:hypothetical protein